MPTIARARSARPSRSPTAVAVGIESARACALLFSSAGLPVCALQPRLEQRHLGGQVVEAASVVGQAGGRLAGLPGTDGALAVGGADVDGAVVVDPAPLGGVAGRERRVPPRARRRPGGAHARPSAAAAGDGTGWGTGAARAARRGLRRAQPAQRAAGSAARPPPVQRALGRDRLGCRLLGRRPARLRRSAAPAARRLGRRLRRSGLRRGGLRRLGGHRLRRIGRVLRNRRSGLLRPVPGVVRARHARQCPTSHPGHWRA